MDTTPKGFGIIGAGMIAGLHADALDQSKQAFLAGVFDIHEPAARKLAEKYGGDVRVYGTVEDMLADPRVAVVNVATPNHLHTPHVLAAAAAGRHVLCEKPPAMSLAETDRMIAACRDAGVRFGIFVQSRVRRPARLIQQALDRGRFGTLLRVDVQMKWYRGPEYYQLAPWRSNPACGAGVTIQQAFHYYDLVQSWIGPAERVEARMCNLAHPGIPVEDTLDARMVFSGGVTGTLFASTALWPGFDVRIELYGSEGFAVMEGTALKEWRFRAESDEDERIRAEGTTGEAAAGSAYDALPSADHQYVIEDCVEAIRTGREICTPCTDVRASLEMALAMYESDRKGCEVTLPLDAGADVWISHLQA